MQPRWCTRRTAAARIRLFQHQLRMQEARTQLARLTGAEAVCALLDLVAAFARHMVGSLAELIAHVILASRLTDARPIVAAVAATALHGEPFPDCLSGHNQPPCDRCA